MQTSFNFSLSNNFELINNWHNKNALGKKHERKRARTVLDSPTVHF